VAHIWDIDNDENLSFEEFIEYFEKQGSSLFDSNLDESASMMRKICNNRVFLAQHIHEVLRGAPATVVNDYSSQIYVLHRSRYFTCRAVIWRPLTGLLGEESFAYEYPHDHDFSFFTAGYYGAGYETEIHEYDHSSISGVPGEHVEMGARQHTQLIPNRVIFFRRSQDIHTQYAPSDFSISINILQNPPAFDISNLQYQFDMEKQTVVQVVNENAFGLLVKLGACAGGDAVPHVLQLAKASRYQSVRRNAITALARHVDPAYLDLAVNDDSPFVKQMCLEDARRYRD
jgi:hypothetical protein